jgi:hypothetical protein
MAGSRKKVSHSVSFPRVLDLSSYLFRPDSDPPKPAKKPRRADAAAGAAGPESFIYDLEAVVLHSGPR